MKPLLKFICLALFLQIFCLKTSAIHLQSTDNIASGDSSSKLSLVCRLKRKPQLKDAKFDNGDRIKVWDSSGRNSIGKLKILSKEKFLIQKRSGSDTFTLSSLVHIKKLPLSRQTSSAILIYLGTGGLLGSIDLMSTPLDQDSSGFSVVAGMFLFIISLPVEIAGIALASGGHFRSESYSFSIDAT